MQTYYSNISQNIVALAYSSNCSVGERNKWTNKFKFSLVLLLAVMISGCFPKAPEDDESHASFAREAIPTLLGRRATGVAEVEVVADIAELLGREKTIQMLMEEEDFVDHWADALVDILKVQRHYVSDGSNAGQDSTCWGDATTEDPDPTIAEWVRDHGPSDVGGPSDWNMTDLLRSSIAIDDLSPIYTAYLFPMAMRRGGFALNNSELSSRFLSVYLNRDTTCLRCHNPTFSTSNVVDSSGDMVWQRLYSVLGHPEKALFNNYYDSAGAFSNLTSLLRSDVRQDAASGVGQRPWNMSVSCATDTDSGSSTNAGNALYTGFQTVSGGGSSVDFGSMDGSVNSDVSLWELQESLKQGIDDLKDGYDRFTASGVILPAEEQNYCNAVDVFAANCNFCHSGASPDGNLDLSSDPAGELVGQASQVASSIEPTRVVANSLADSELWSRINSTMIGYGMPHSTVAPISPISQGDKDAIDDWINSGAVGIDIENCNTSDIPDVAPDEALAFLTASNAVDGIWQALMGYRLTIDHGFPRTAEQRDMLWNLTESTFIQEDWSLKAVLSKVMTSDWYARRAPSISQLDSAHPLKPILDPWVIAHPDVVANRTDEQLNNGKGEQVVRYRVNTVLRSIADSLGWKEPVRFDDGDYPSNLDENLGQYRSDNVTGFDSVTFQSLLALEDEIGLCDKSQKSVDNDDWIDVLVDQAAAFNVANPAAPITVGEVYATLKDRMIQDTEIVRELPQELQGVLGAVTEETAVVALFNAGSASTHTLNSSTDDLSAVDLEAKLRESCGVLVKTPQFLLSNLTPSSYSDNQMPDPTRLLACLDGQSCGYQDSCGHWRSTLWDMGDYIACEESSVRTSLFSFRYWPLIENRFADAELVKGPFTPITRWNRSSGKSAELVNLESRSKDQIEQAKKDQASMPKQKLQRAKFDAQYIARSAAICPGGICGFVARPSVESCIASAKSASCSRLSAQCDPRVASNANSCSAPQSDLREAGVHVAWLEGAVVESASGVRILRPDVAKDRLYKGSTGRLAQSKKERFNLNELKGRDKRVETRLSKRQLTKLQASPTGPYSSKKLRWRKLKKGESLSSGDLIDIPLNAEIKLRYNGEIVDAGPAIRLKGSDRANRHVLSITGVGNERLLNTPSKREALSVAQLRAGFQQGKYASKAPNKKQLARLARLSPKPNSVRTLTYKELLEASKDYNANHINDDKRFTPEGNDRQEKYKN